MAPIKFEENIKERLEKRTLAPSAGGWSKLSERLDMEDKKSKKPIFWWLSIAAGLLLMISISVQFFNGDDADSAIPQVVEKEVIEKPMETNKSELETLKDIQLVMEEPEIIDEKENLEAIKKIEIIDYKKEAQSSLKIETKLAEQNSTTQEQGPNKDTKGFLNEDIMKNAVTEALDTFKSENTSVTDREIDSLLKVASKELFNDKLRKETSKIVDADALLESVEDDMGQAFRSKVFDALKGSYETVKTAVAERYN
jgi:hypothetical protein